MYLYIIQRIFILDYNIYSLYYLLKTIIFFIFPIIIKTVDKGDIFFNAENQTDSNWESGNVKQVLPTYEGTYPTCNSYF